MDKLKVVNDIIERLHLGELEIKRYAMDEGEGKKLCSGLDEETVDTVLKTLYILNWYNYLKA